MSLKDLAKYVGGLVLAAALLWWVFRGTDPGSLWEQLGQASIVGLIASAALNIGHIVFRVWRWRALLAPVQPGVPFRPMFSACVVGYLTTWVVPGRLGELVRPMLLAARERVALGPAVGSVVADRLLDAAAVVVLFAVGSWITPLPGPAAEYASVFRGASLFMAVSIAVMLTGMLVVSSAHGRLKPWLDRRSAAVRWVGNMLVSLSRGAQSLRSPRLALVVAVHSLLAWLTIALGTWIGIRAAGVQLSFGTVLTILPMLVLGVAVPTPGGAGSYHGAMKAGLLLFGVAELPAVGAGLLVHGAVTAPIILLGTVLLWTERISWKDMIAAARNLRHLGGDGGAATTEGALEGVR